MKNGTDSADRPANQIEGVEVSEEVFAAGYARWLSRLSEESANGLPIADADHQRLLQEVRRSVHS